MDAEDEPRRHTIYFRINKQLSFPVFGLSTSLYALLKHNDDEAFDYVRNLCETGTIVNNDGQIEALFRSIDDLDYTLVKPKGHQPPFASFDENEASTSSNSSSTVINADDSQVASKDQMILNDSQQKNSGVTKKKFECKQSSPVWQYFEKESPVSARCKICNKVYKHSGNTTNLTQHLSTSHALFCSAAIGHKRKILKTAESSDESIDDPLPLKRTKSQSQRKLTRIDEAFDRTKSFLKGGKMFDRITNSILYMIAVDKDPYSKVEKEGFTALMKTVAPLYSLPSRKTVTKLLDVRYETLKERFVTALEDVASYTLTCDNWTDNTNESYLGVTIHYVTEESKLKSGCLGVFSMDERHTSEYLTQRLESVVEDFKLDKSKISAVVTDSAANIKKAVRDFIGQDKQLACFAHTLSHLVPDVLSAMPAVRETIAKVKAIVTLIRRSVTAHDELKKLQLRDGKTAATALTFIQDVPTRWNSTLYMLERFLTLEEYVYPVMSKCPNSPDMLKREEMYVLKDVVALMKPVECVITEVSGDSYPTCSVIIPLVHCLEVAVREYTPTTKCGNEFKEKLQATIDRRFKDFEFNKTLAISTILDSRFKKLHFQSALAASSAISRINDLIKKDNTVQKAHKKVCEDPPGKNLLWGFHDHLVATKADANTHSEDVSFEIRQYLSQSVIPRHEDPLKYWSAMKLTFPALYKLAMKFVGIIGTSVPSERIFSQSGDIKTDDRNRLTGEHLNKLLFLSTLTRKEWGVE